MRRGTCAGLLVLILAVCAISIAATASPQSPSGGDLTSQLNAQYKTDLVLVILKDGILGVTQTSPVTCPSKFQDGSLHGPNGLCMMAVKNSSKTLTNGEKVHPTKVEVDVKKEQVKLSVIECDSCNNGQTQSYKAQVVFQFPKGYLETAEAGQVGDLVGQVFGPDNGGGDQQQQGQDQAGGQQQAQQQDQGPPPAPASIQLGQTIDQVQSAFGQPEKIVNLGAKQIYVYKDLKVTFLNGKVVDVQ